MNGKYSFLYLIDKVVLLQFAEVHTIHSRWPGNGGSLGYHCIQQGCDQDFLLESKTVPEAPRYLKPGREFLNFHIEIEE